MIANFFKIIGFNFNVLLCGIFPKLRSKHLKLLKINLGIAVKFIKRITGLSGLNSDCIDLWERKISTKTFRIQGVLWFVIWRCTFLRNLCKSFRNKQAMTTLNRLALCYCMSENSAARLTIVFNTKTSSYKATFICAPFDILIIHWLNFVRT